ncbi:MBL fold metallo-hydrolase [Sinomonas sp. ASV322]|uniref:MBL fold metallo-hydrolase n=1 Tax=Sinomonas sp. ASV322 TaxID=3041920 RepID=UPI0027DB51F9|nr:MBL fold metallo-hydrolase [Sinomonas sp. ASV322]MDQ4503543.1 MBL fold metallo-hydrolase [Sinomonas sp. ASV322]
MTNDDGARRPAGQARAGGRMSADDDAARRPAGQARAGGRVENLDAARRIADGVFWLGGCLSAFSAGEEVHYHVSSYLVVGSRASLLVDTGDPAHRALVLDQLEAALGGRTLDYVFPTHPEIPHAGNLPALLERFPEARVVGDVRDYALHFPEFEGRFDARRPGDSIDLGGREFRFLPAHIRDLENTVWGHDSGARMLFVSDGFSFIHDVPLPDGDDDEPVHRPGQCRLFSGEMPAPPSVEQAAYGTGRALYWTKFVDVSTAFAEIERMLAELPTELIGPAHGNVIDDVGGMLATSLAAHRRVYDDARKQ